MNIVKGVTGFLRRASASQEGQISTGVGAESSITAQSWPDVQFSQDGAEESLNRMWQDYEEAPTKAKRQKTLEEFILKFNLVFERWVPQSTDGEESTSEESTSNVEDNSETVVVGCSFGHPTRIIAGFVEELKRTSDFIAELHASSNVTEPFTNTNDMEAALSLLCALTIVTRASHNRIIFSFFGGLQVLTGLMKHSVLHVKGVSNTATPDTAPGSSALMLLSFLQCLLAHIVSITANFIDSKKHNDNSGQSSTSKDAGTRNPRSNARSLRQRRSFKGGEVTGATNSAPLLETGGLNWFVELLRTLRRLRLGGIVTDGSLEKLTLQTLKAAIAANPRAQNHFRSIGGIEVLLDGLGSFPNSMSSTAITDGRIMKQLVENLNLQVLSFEAIREAVFRNVNSLQSVLEMGGLLKFIQVFRWAAFSFPGCLTQLSADTTSNLTDSAMKAVTSNSWRAKSADSEHLKEKDLIFHGMPEDKDNLQGWNSNVSHLCEILCSFLVASGDTFSLSGSGVQDASGVTGLYWESATRFIVNVLLGVFRDTNVNDDLQFRRLISSDLQRNILNIFKKMLAISPPVLQLFREEGVWTVLFSEYFFYFGLDKRGNLDTEPLQLEVISFVELAATVNGNANNLLECNTLIQALEQCLRLPKIAVMLLKSLHRILQLAPESTCSSFKQLDIIVVLSEVMAIQVEALKHGVGDESELLQCRDAAFSLFNEYMNSSEDAKSVALRSMKLMDVLFNLVCDSRSRNFAIHHISNFMKLAPSSEEDQDGKMELCMKYLETLSRIQSDCHLSGVSVLLDLLAILRDVLQSDFPYYQALFREVECFVHIVSLLNEAYPPEVGRQLCLEVIMTLIHLLKGNEASKLAFRALVGPGYKMLQTLLVDRHQGHPNQGLLAALLDMLVDGKFEIPYRMVIQNEDVIMLFFNIIRQCDEDNQLKALDISLKLLEESTANQASCVKAGLLCLLLDWFSAEHDELVIGRVAQLMQLVGGHSMSGKEMRRIFSLLRNTMNISKPKNILLLSTFKSMLKEQGPSVFFELNGRDSGIVVTTPLRWPTNKGYSFLCWIRLESSCSEGMAGLFSFLTEDGKGCTALISANKLTIESATHKRQTLSIEISLKLKQWHFICITHSTGRALSTGSLFKVYVDGSLIGSEKLRYARVYDVMSRCTIGASAPCPIPEGSDEQKPSFSSPLCGQLGPIYLFDEVLAPDQVQGIYMLGAGYMYSFLPSEVGCVPASMPADSLFSSKDGLALKMIFGYNAQARNGRSLFDVAPVSEQSQDRVPHEATIMAGTQLCYRCLVQNNIHCVGGISVFFPLLTRLEQPFRHKEAEETGSIVPQYGDDSYLVDVIELLAAVLTGNFANQKFLSNSGGLSILGFLLQLVPSKQLTVKVVAALNSLLAVLAQANDSTLSETLVKEAIIKIYLNTSVWIYASYVVQRELYLSLINFLENRNSFTTICGLSRFLDMLHQFYWDKTKVRRNSKTTHIFANRSSIGERPQQEELSQLRILILSIAEGVVRHRITLSDTKSLISFIDRSDDLACVEEILQMLLGLLGESDFLSSFSECMQVLGGFHILLNLLKRQQEAIRLLALHILGALFLATPAERKSTRLFGIGSGASKGASDHITKRHKDAFIWCSILERLLLFPFTDVVRNTLFDLLLGGSISKQILQGGLLTQFGKSAEKRSWLTKLKSAGNPARTSSFPQFFFPRMLGIILKFVVVSDDWTTREAVLKDILVMIESNPSNCELLIQEPAWQDWLFAVLASVCTKKQQLQEQEVDRAKLLSEEEFLVRKIISAVHFHAVCNIRGGWRHVARTATYVWMYAGQALFSSHNLLHELLADLVEDVLHSRPAQASLSLQPCRDNVLYLLSLVEELAVRDAYQFLPFLSDPTLEESQDNSLLSGSYVDLGSETRRDDNREAIPVLDDGERKQSARTIFRSEASGLERRLYDKVWSLIGAVNGKGQGPTVISMASSTGPSFGQRARGLVESLNIPAAEVAAVVTGGLGSVGINVPSKLIEKAVKLRGEKFSRVAFRLLLLYLYKADLEAAMFSVQQFLPLLPSFLSVDTEQNKGQLHLLLWCLFDARTHVGAMDDGARYHVVSQLIQEVLEAGKSSLATSLAGKEKNTAEIVSNESSMYSLLQQDKVLAAVRDERKFLRASKQQWAVEVEALRAELNETRAVEAQGLEEQAQTVINGLHNSEMSRRAAYQLKCDEDEQAVANQWGLIFRNLTDERGPWSSAYFPSSNPVWWKLDKTEDPLRRRPKLKRNYHINQKHLRPPTSLGGSASSESVIKMLSDGRVRAQKVSGNIKAFLHKDIEDAEEDDEMHDAKDEFENEVEPENSTGFSEEDGTELKQGAGEDEVMLSVSCILVSPKRKLAGRFEITQLALHFHVEFIVEGTGGSMVFDSSGGFNHDDTNDSINAGKRDGALKQLSNIKQHRKWDLTQVTAIYGTRYLLQHTALEVHFADAAPPVFLNFHSQQITKNVALKIIACRNGTGAGKSSLKDRNQIHYVDRKKAAELAERARDCWRRRECSNFEYLMILNTLSGRSHNDLTQYPVFPWVLADYSSETLDLSNPSVFRDLSKPIGALDEKRFKVFHERFNNFIDPDIPSFHYGSHYSSMGIVLFYLLRLEPFTLFHRMLQGGKFDHADRLFHSIQGAYSNCMTNTSDVKELIPEFFYMPEFLTNTNKYFIGVKQDGQQLDDVILPPWAKGSPEQFIRMNREALESEHTSEHLHQWIDLIFGYKQRGRPAVEAANVFYYLTYEGAVELESREDAQQRASVEDQIASFGQTPIQLFRKKHPKRGPVAPILRPLYYSPGSITLTSSISSRYLSSGTSEQDPPIVFLGHSDGKIISLTTEMVASVRLWITPSGQSGGSFTFSSSQDVYFGLGSDVWPPRRIGGYYAETLEVNPACFGTLQFNSSTYLLTCGHWDNSFKLISLSDGHMIQSNCQHKDVVTCVSVSVDGSIVVTGSRDTTVTVWEVASLSRKRTKEVSKHDVIISDKPRHVLCGHDDVVTCLVVRTELDLVVSGSKDGTCILHTLRQGRYVRSLVHPNRSSVSALVVSQHGFIVLFSNDDLTLRLCSVNGKWLAEAELNGRLNCMDLSNCGGFLVCGGDQGQVTVRKMHSLELVHRYDGTGSPISCLSVTPEDCFLVGTRDGKILIFSVEAGSRKGIKSR